ncbi:DEAD/DEAH box helicase [Enterococcus malodoratus]|uniref:DEAD/DEAH box helicase n=1 Tax=Enterococcus malodoratus TaxID=71451 RepID=UPI003FD350AF
MTSQTIIQELNNRAISDDYLYELLKKIQINYGFKIFEKKYEMLTERELFDILRFSDILSRSEDSLNRNISLKIISVLFDDYCDDEIYQLFSKNVLVKLGNFPSLRFLEASGNQIDNEEIELDKIIKQVFQKTTISEQYFTDSQFETFNKITNANHFSFSAGTSFGKSFLFTEYIKWLIEEKNASENIAFLVPTRALISQVVSDLSESIHNSKYKIISNPDIPAIFRNQKFIFVFTPERLISYFSEASNPNISTMIIDEAHNTIADDERCAE